MDKPVVRRHKRALILGHSECLESLAMQCTQTQSEGLNRVFRVVIPRQQLQTALDGKIDEVRPKVALKGFRPGKAPVAHIRKVYGPGLLREIIDNEVQKGTRQAIEEASVRVATEPHLHLEADIEAVLRGEADLAFHFHVEVMPDFVPVQPETLRLERLVAPVEVAQISESERVLLANNRAWDEREGLSEDGDRVTLDYVGRIDGEIFEGGSAEGAQVVIGSNQFIPGFEPGLIGLRAGEERALAVEFPKEYGVADLAGKSAVFDVKIIKIEQPREAMLDDAFAKQFGLEDVEALRNALKAQLEAEHAKQARLRMKRVLFDQLDAGHSFDLPPAMVNAEFAQIWAQVEADRERGGLDDEDAAKPEDVLKEDYRRIAERRVRLGLILAEIGGRSNVQVSQQELSNAIVAQARQFPGQEKQVFEFFQKNPNALAQVRAPIYEEKVVDYIFELAQIEERVVSREELFADPDEASPPAP